MKKKIFAGHKAKQLKTPVLKTYLVTWKIDIMAESPQEAAKEALRIQRDSSSGAVYFTTKDKSGKTVDVDLLYD